MRKPAHDLVTVGVRGNQGSAGGRIMQAGFLVGQQGRDGVQGRRPPWCYRFTWRVATSRYDRRDEKAEMEAATKLHFAVAGI